MPTETIPGSLREGIVQALLDVLNSGSNRPAMAYRTRTEPLQLDQLPAYVVRLRHEARSREGSTTSLSRLAIRVECLTRGEAPQDEALDPLLVYAVQKFYLDNTEFSSRVTGGS